MALTTFRHREHFYLFYNIIIIFDLFGVKDAAHGEEREEKGKIAFFCGNPMVEVIKGIIHIYKNKWVECQTIIQAVFHDIAIT